MNGVMLHQILVGGEVFDRDGDIGGGNLLLHCCLVGGRFRTEHHRVCLLARIELNEQMKCDLLDGVELFCLLKDLFG